MPPPPPPPHPSLQLVTLNQRVYCVYIYNLVLRNETPDAGRHHKGNIIDAMQHASERTSYTSMHACLPCRPLEVRPINNKTRGICTHIRVRNFNRADRCQILGRGHISARKYRAHTVMGKPHYMYLSAFHQLLIGQWHSI